MAADKYRCRECHKNVAATGRSPSPLRYRKHDSQQSGTECGLSRTIIPGWLVKRGPEAEDSDAPVIGRDYAPCPGCGRSPLLDDGRKYADHITDPGVPAAERTVCPKSGQPYEAPPNESEEMISKWATQARAIENRELPPPSPESTTTSPNSPPQQSDPDRPTPATDAVAPAEALPEPQSSAGAAADAITSTGPEPRLCHIAADHPPHRWMHRRKVTQCPGRPVPEEQEGKPGTAAGPLPATPPPAPAPAATRQAPTQDAATAPTASPAPASPSAESSPTAKPSASPAPASPVADASTTPESTSSAAATSPDEPTPPDVQALADIFPRTPPPPGEPWFAPDAGGGEPKDPAPPLFAQPGSPFAQPGRLPAAVTDPIPMTVLAEQVVARMKELFFAYDNRQTADNRSAQSTLGPSEIGTPCDRRLAMSLLGIPAVHPGGDGWAAFVGTAVHEALARMFQWADAGSGRFAVEVPLTFPSEHVPKGTSDLLDRTLFMVDDHKAQGRWALDKLRTEGIPPGYRVQLHTYGFGQRIKGERIDYVALISWPRESSSLDDLYAVVEPYDPQIARDALARVDRIAAEVKAHETERATWAGLDVGAQKLGIAKEFAVDPESCRYCPFFAPGDPGMTRGCNGRA